MSIRMNYQGYLAVEKDTNFSTSLFKKSLKKLKSNQRLRKINGYGSIITCIVLSYIAIETKSGIFVVGIIGLFLAAILWRILQYRASVIRSRIDKEIFDNFLVDKLKIMYSDMEKVGIEYDTIKHVSTRILNPINVNQAVIDLAYMAYEEKAEGMIVVNSDSSSFTSQVIGNKAGASAITNFVNSVEAILIKNIKRNNSKPINERLDLNYWYELKEKGAITQAEYEAKKKELL